MCPLSLEENMEYKNLSKDELLSLKAELEKKYETFKSLGLKLDMSRGKPNKAQLDLSNPVLDVLVSSSDMKASDGFDTRNYGVLLGIPEARELFGELMGVPSKHVII